MCVVVVGGEPADRTTLSWRGGKKENPKYTKVRVPARGAAQVKYKEASARQSRRRGGGGGGGVRGGGSVIA